LNEDMTAEARGVWSSQLQFILSCVGFSVGLGNLWRFPVTAYKNGGVAFLVPYIICSILVGLPVLYLELFIGQFTQSGPSKAFRNFMPALQGLGWAMSAVSFLTGIFYNMVVAWILRYLFDIISLQSYKWTTCGNYWNTISAALLSSTYSPTSASEKSVKATTFRYRLLNYTDDITQTGSFNWEICFALLVAWTTTCLSIIKGVSVIGKISFLTATLPYVIIVIMAVRGVTLDGSYEGIKYFLLRPDLSKILVFKTWLEATKQLCFSLGIGFGGLLSLSSFNKRSHNCFRDAIIVATCDATMSVVGGIAVFSTLGYLSKSSGRKIEDLFSERGTLPRTASFVAIFFLPCSLPSPLNSFLESITVQGSVFEKSACNRASTKRIYFVCYRTSGGSPSKCRKFLNSSAIF
uniref:Transporter n=1 Tax=Heligmosomoides polygyrus TaxID=6339 RepID=A0A183GDR4_HELPZ